MNNKYFFSLIILLLVGCSSKDLKEVDAIQSVVDCTHLEDFNIYMLSVIDKAKVNHVNIYHIDNLLKKYGDPPVLEGCLNKEEFEIFDREKRTKLKYYLLDNELILIERFIMMTQDEINRDRPSILDSVSIIEYYYINGECCMREQLSYGCANISRMNINDEVCKSRISMMRKLLDKMD